jgi:hypothetical protein
MVFNFVFDFINRFALSDDPVIAGILDRVIPGEDWRGPLRALDVEPAPTPDRRKRVLVDAFGKAVSRIGRYLYVADAEVRRPNRDRALYFLIYGTRQPPGIGVFRDCQFKSLSVQSDIQARKRIADHSAASSQLELLGRCMIWRPTRTEPSWPPRTRKHVQCCWTSYPQPAEGSHGLPCGRKF